MRQLDVFSTTEHTGYNSLSSYLLNTGSNYLLMNSPHPSAEKLYALFQEAFTLHEENRLEEAEHKYHQILQHANDAWLVHYNLGLLYYDLGRFENSIDHYKSALRYAGPDADIYFNLAICLKHCDRYDESIKAYKAALEITPDDSDCLYNLAGCHLAAEAYDKAAECYLKLLAATPNHEPALNNLAYLYHKNSEKKKALHFYLRLLEVNPSHQSAAHMCNALQGNSSDNVPSDYIKDVFDQYCDHYEDSLLNRLEYRLPELLLDFTLGSSGKSEFKSVLDLGCGTGLSGEAFKSRCVHIDGIDISQKMLEKARKKEVYRHLWSGEITSVLAHQLPEKYDLLLAADVFAYFGDLAPMFAQAAKYVVPGGLFYFSVEKLEDPSNTTFTLRESGRFAHSEIYIRETAENHRWNFIDSRTLNLRKERGVWIQGVMYGLRAK